MVWDFLQIHRNRFEEFIEDDFDNYIDQLKKILRTWDGELDITAFSYLYEVNIQVYKYTLLLFKSWIYSS